MRYLFNWKEWNIYFNYMWLREGDSQFYQLHNETETLGLAFL